MPFCHYTGLHRPAGTRVRQDRATTGEQVLIIHFMRLGLFLQPPRLTADLQPEPACFMCGTGGTRYRECKPMPNEVPNSSMGCLSQHKHPATSTGFWAHRRRIQQAVGSPCFWLIAVPWKPAPSASRNLYMEACAQMLAHLPLDVFFLQVDNTKAPELPIPPVSWEILAHQEVQIYRLRQVIPVTRIRQENAKARKGENPSRVD